MSEFKGTKGPLEMKYVSGVCIGIGTVGSFSQITANSILPETDKEYKKEKTEIEANMLLYSKAPEMLQMLERVYELLKWHDDFNISEEHNFPKEILNLIKEATEI